MDEQTDSYDQSQFRLFMETSSLLGGVVVQDGWFPFLPKPGTYKHPLYGEVKISRAGNQALVDSVKNQVYQEHIPIDAEHHTKLSGAVAWLTDMQMNEDGSADGFFEWTTRGRTLVSGGQFKYFSPEFFGEWTDPATGVVHKNVVAGGAITTRPFFKDKVLRALVASEDGAEVIDGGAQSMTDPADRSEENSMKKCESCGQSFEGSGTLCQACSNKKMSDPAPTNPNPTEDTHQMTEQAIQARIDAAVAAAEQKFTEATTTQFAELTARVTAAEALAATEKSAREQTAAALKSMQDEARERRFREIISGRGETDGAAWLGDADKHLTLLTRLSETFGEDSDEVKSYVEQQTSVASQMQTTVFKEYGTSRPGALSGSDEQKLETLAKAYSEKNDVSYEQAYAAVLSTDEGSALYERIGQTH